jgi:hypothetical protein
MKSRITILAASLVTLAACPAPPAPDTGPALDRVTVAPYGTWRSHITPGLVSSRGRSFSSPLLLAADGKRAYWVEGRPEEGGRAVLVQWTEGRGVEDLTGAPFDVRTRVHEYGGGAFVVAGETIVFSNAGDGRLYLLERGGKPRPLTPAGGKLRYADLQLHAGRLIAVREDHRVQGKEAVNTLVAIELDRGGEGEVLAAGEDFYASPRPSPDGKQLAWLSWSHPNMPWDGTELWVAGASGENPRQVAGGPRESIFQPEWSPGGVLHFVSDRSGWWNLHRLGEGDGAEPLQPMKAEFGLPQWVFGLSSYAFAGEGEIICSFTRDGVSRLARLDTASGKLTRIPTPYTFIVNVRAAAGRVLYEGGSPTRSVSVVRHDRTIPRGRSRSCARAWRSTWPPTRSRSRGPSRFPPPGAPPPTPSTTGPSTPTSAGPGARARPCW